MPFTTLSKARLPRRRNQKAKVHIYTVEHRRFPGSVDVRIRLTKPLLDELGWSETQRVNVMVGTEADAGVVILEPNPDSDFRLRRSSASSFALSSRSIPLPVGIKAQCQFEIKEGGHLLVTYG